MLLLADPRKLWIKEVNELSLLENCLGRYTSISDTRLHLTQLLATYINRETCKTGINFGRLCTVYCILPKE